MKKYSWLIALCLSLIFIQTSYAQTVGVVGPAIGFPSGGGAGGSSAAAYTVLGNFTSSAATPTYSYAPIGAQALTTTATLTADSPSYNYCTGLTGFTVNLPVASTCIGKELTIYSAITAYSTTTISRQSSDVVEFGQDGNAVTSFTIQTGMSVKVIAVASGVWQVVQAPFPILTLNPTPTSGGILVGAAGTGHLAYLNAGTSGQLLQILGTGPTYTSTPGSGTSLTSITVTHQIGGGTAPTVAVGAGAGTGGSPGATITGHDTDFVVTLTTGTTAGTGVIFTVTFGAAYASAPIVQVTPASAATAALVGGLTQSYPTSTTTTTVLNSGSTGLTAAGAVYVFNVHVGQ